MKKSYIFIGIFLILIVVITIILTNSVTGNICVNSLKDTLTTQSKKEVYFKPYGYSVDNPNVIVNPYGNSPLTGIVMFETTGYSEVNIKILSKDGDSDINYTFKRDKYHFIPIYGLYADYDNKVIISSEGINKTISIKTDKLPEDFVYLDNMEYDNFNFYNSNYPYIIDKNGEVRWYLNSNYYGNISPLPNSSFVIGSNQYNEEGSSISLYRMNYLGKIYNEYLINNYYYGYSAIYNGDLIILSDKIISLDITTGNVKNTYNNDNYSYLGVYNDNILVKKDNEYFEIKDEELTISDYTERVQKIDFYNETTNYEIKSSLRSGNLIETPTSKKNISLINAKKTNDTSISILKDVNRIKVTNSYDTEIYVILDKFLDKRVYEVKDIKYINLSGLSGKYTVYFRINDKTYRTDYYIEV